MIAASGLHVHRLGTGARPALALHCSLAHGRVWAGLARHLPALTLQAPDLPGHGDSPDWDGRGDYHDHCTAQSLALLHDLAAQGPVDVLGHSLGGTLALRLALDRPDLVRSLTLFEPVLFCAAAGEPEFAAFLAAQDPYASAARVGDWPKAAQMFHQTWGASEEWATLPPARRSYLADRMPLVARCDRVLFDDSAGMLAPSRPEALALPVLLVQGALSPPIIAAILRVLAARLPQATQHSVTGAGHMLPITHAAQLGPVVSAHLG